MLDQIIESPEMKVVGMTTQQEVFIASQKRKFRINEILIIEDEALGQVRGEVVETSSFNSYIPLTTERNKMIDNSVLENLRQVGYSIDDAETNIAKVRMLTELIYPVKTGSNVRLPLFEEIEKMLIQNKNGWNIGVLRGTEEIAPQMPEDLQDRGSLYYPEPTGMISYNQVPFLFNYKTMSEYPHLGIFGGSGSGKSFGSRVIEEEIMKCRIPAIVADPHYEKEFNEFFPELPDRHKTNFKNRYEVFTVGKDIGIPYEQLTANEFVNLLSAGSSDVSENMDSAVRHLFQRGGSLDGFILRINDLCYAHENKPTLEKDYANMTQLEPDAKAIVERRWNTFQQFESKCNHSAAKGIQWRLNALLKYGLFKGDISEAMAALKARKLVVVRGSISNLKLFLSFFIQKAYDSRREYRDSISQGVGGVDFFPPFFTILDEAHNFAPKGTEAPTKRVIKEIAQEGRKYGAFLGLATQRPALLDDTIMAQLSTKFLFRTVRGQDIKSLSEETDLSASDANRLPYLPSGECFVSSAILGRTVAVRVRCAITKSPNSQNPFDELDEMSISAGNPLAEAIIQHLPFASHQIGNILTNIEKMLNIRTSKHELLSTMEELVEQGRVAESKTPFGSSYKGIE